MAKNDIKALSKLLGDQESGVLSEWQRQLKSGATSLVGRISEAELNGEAKSFLALFRQAIAVGADPAGANFDKVREFLAGLSRSRALKGFSPTETATFVFSLKPAIFAILASNDDSVDSFFALNTVLDALALYTTEAYQKSREEVILRQQREITELSTPVVKLWDGILALPLIGTLDSERTQTVMENLLESIVAQSADIAIIDITGVPTVDTLTAQHLLKAIAAARLMGAECLISGIRPQIAQTMVHLGVDLNVVSKASLADAFALALQKRGRAVVKVGATAKPG